MKQTKYGNGKDFEKDPKYILLLVSFLCVCLIFFSYKFEQVLQPVRATVVGLVAPLQKGITVLGRSTNEFFHRFDDVNRLNKENQLLRDQILELEAKVDTLQGELYDLERYKQLLGLMETYPEYETVACNIIARDTSGYYATFTIDKGTKHGITTDMNVIADNGLVGLVTDVGPNYAIVRSIIDDGNFVSASIQKTGDECVVGGDLELLDSGFLQVLDISINSQVKNNYKVYTSNLSEKYLPGILIGYLSNITITGDGLSQSGYLTPVVDFEHLSTVLVIKQRKASPVTETENK